MGRLATMGHACIVTVFGLGPLWDGRVSRLASRASALASRSATRSSGPPPRAFSSSTEHGWVAEMAVGQLRPPERYYTY